MIESLRRVETLLRHELRRAVRSPRTLVALYGTPLVLTLVADLAFNWPGALPGDLAVQDRDHSRLSGRMADGMLASRTPHVFRLGAGIDARAYVVAHPNTVVAVIPEGLQAQVLAGQSPPITAVADRRGQRQAGPAMNLVKTAAEEVSAIATAVGAARVAASGHTPVQVNAAAQEAMNGALSSYTRDRVKVTTDWQGRSVPSSYTRLAQWATGNGTMFMMFAAVTLAAALADDRRGGRVRRLLWTRLRVRELILAKALSMMALVVVVILLMLAESALFFGMSLGPSVPLLAVVVAADVVAVTGYALLVLGAARVSPLVHGLGITVTLGFAAAGGSWWPAETEAPILQRLGHLTPNAWAADAFHGLLYFDQTGWAVWFPVLMLVALGLAMGGLGSVLFSRQVRGS